MVDGLERRVCKYFQTSGASTMHTHWELHPWMFLLCLLPHLLADITGESPKTRLARAPDRFHPPAEDHRELAHPHHQLSMSSSLLPKVEPASANWNVVSVRVIVPHYWEQVFLRSPPILCPFRLSQFLSDSVSPPESCLLACKRALFLPSRKNKHWEGVGDREQAWLMGAPAQLGKGNF